MASDIPLRKKRVLVVIVNFRTAELTVDSLRSLETDLGLLRNLSVIVTDNRSEDDSVEQIGQFIADQRLSSRVRLMPLERNGGFAYGNNCAIRSALESDSPPEFVLLLNPDTIVRPGAVKTMVEFMSGHPDVGIVGCRLEDPDGTPQRSAFRFPSMASEFERAMRLGIVSSVLSRWIVAPPVVDADTRTDWVSGASMLVRGEVFESIGLLDEGFFMYYEELDFCERANNAGWECWYSPAGRVVHLVGQASGIDVRRPMKRRPGYWFESRRRYFLRNRGRLYTAGCDFAFVVGCVLWKIRRFVQRKPETDPPRMLFDFIRHSVFCRGFSL